MPIHVLVVDDTVIYRKILTDIVESMPGTERPAAVPSGALALRKLALKPYDLILLDLEMPEMDGIETLRHIKRDHPDSEVVIVSAVNEAAAAITMKALRGGALGFVPKPTTSGIGESVEQLSAELEPYFHIAAKKKGLDPAQFKKKRPARSAATREASKPRLLRPRASLTASLPRDFAILAIGVSTGGPQALQKIIPALPDDFPLPIVLVQHMPPVFTTALAADLDRKSSLTVKEAAEGDLVEPGVALIAPGGKHMVLRRDDRDKIVARMNEGPKENNCRPAVDVLFRSVGQCYGKRGVLALICTGMGADGLKGVESLKRKGCYCLTQSEATCVVYGMPGVVDEAGLSDESLDLEQIANRLSDIARRGAKQP